MRGAKRVATVLARISIRMRPLLKSRLVADGAGSRVIVMCTDEPMSVDCDGSSVELGSSHFVALADRPSLSKGKGISSSYSFEIAGCGQPYQRRYKT